MKILILGMNEAVGGIETYIMNLFRHLDKDVYKLYFPDLPKLAYREEILSLGGVLIEELPRSRRNPISYYSKWLRLFQKYRFDVVYFNNCDIVSLDVLRLAKMTGVPVRVFHAHNSSNTLPLKWHHKISEKVNRASVGYVATNLLACSKNAGDYIFGKNPYIEVKNGIDVERFKFDRKMREEKRNALGLENKKVMLFVGRFTEIKNPLFAIEIANELYKIDNRYISLICGEGPLMSQATELIDKYNCGNWGRLMGNRNDINELYQAADLLIMPSLFEGFPFVLVEAQCAGVKCVCSDRVETNTNLTDTIEYVPLKMSARQWAEKIERLQFLENREGFVEVIREKGFDIGNTVKIVEHIISGGGTYERTGISV